MTFTFLGVGSLLFQNWKLYRLKSTHGYSSDYALTSFMGYYFLLYNQVLGIVSPYTPAGRVHLMDIMCFIGLLTSACLSLTQTMIYPHDSPYKVTLIAWFTVFTLWLVAGVLEGYKDVFIFYKVGLDWALLAVMIKSFGTFFKYMF